MILPMFPLGMVLFPHQPLPLQIFEPRYKVLLLDCAQAVEDGGEPAFGVTLIERGSEVGGGEQAFDLGTVAVFREVQELPDGRFACLAQGVRRIRVQRWLEPDPYPRAEVEHLPDLVVDRDRHAEPVASVEREVRRCLDLLVHLGEGRIPPEVGLSPEPSTALWQLASLCPTNPIDQLGLLGATSADDLLDRLGALAADAAAMLAFRAGQG